MKQFNDPWLYPKLLIAAMILLPFVLWYASAAAVYYIYWWIREATNTTR